MLLRLATAVAATSALVLAGTTPALADHEVPEFHEGNIECSDIGLEQLGDKVEPPANVDNEFFTATVTDVDGEPRLLDVVAKDGVVIDAVLVKGTPDTHVFRGPDFTHMFAPEAGGSGQPAAISHFNVCGTVDEDVPGEEDGEEPGEEEGEEPGEEEGEEPGEEDGEEPGGEPAPVPTAVPAGSASAGFGTIGTAGLFAAIAALFVSAALIVRRRFLHDS